MSRFSRVHVASPLALPQLDVRAEWVRAQLQRLAEEQVDLRGREVQLGLARDAQTAHAAALQQEQACCNPPPGKLLFIPSISPWGIITPWNLSPRGRQARTDIKPLKVTISHGEGEQLPRDESDNFCGGDRRAVVASPISCSKPTPSVFPSFTPGAPPVR